jgi:uncharacterized protein YecE (DUF72 family)
MSATHCKIGCCGFAMARPKYFETFPLVEVQKTFYEPPMTRTARRWREKAPEGFEFTVKAWQLITHEASSPTYRRMRTELSDVQTQQAGSFRPTPTVLWAWQKTLEIVRLLESDKVLFQCPAGFKPTPESRDHMRRFFAGIDREGVTCLWEPRGQWRGREIAELCDECRLVHCVDPFQAEPVTAGLGYYRLHGVGGYRHRFTDEELRRLADRVGEAGESYVLFNNMSMAADARRFRELVG